MSRRRRFRNRGRRKARRHLREEAAIQWLTAGLGRPDQAELLAALRDVWPGVQAHGPGSAIKFDGAEAVDDHGYVEGLPLGYSER